MRPILTADSVTEIGPQVRGAVLVAGSHGGIIAGHLAATAGAYAVILNDAGVGKDAAGIAALDYLGAIGMAAATVGHASARIGSGAHMLANGVISHVNGAAAALGVVSGQPCRDAAVRLTAAAAPRAAPPPYAEGRALLLQADARQVWALDSVGMLLPEDENRILIIGSHGALHGGRTESALPVDAYAAVFNDAGVGPGAVGISRLPALAARGIAAATVGCDSARIGDGRSMWQSGIVSFVNAVAERFEARPGESVRRFVERLC
jgi:hypothetical protein